MTTESAVLTAVLKHLGNREDCRVARMNVGNSRGIIAAFVDRLCKNRPTVAAIVRAFFAHDKAATRFGVPGMADVMGVRAVKKYPYPLPTRTVIRGTSGCEVVIENGDRVNLAHVVGQIVAVECKSSTGRQSPAQVAFQRMIESFGGLYILENDPALPNVRRYFP